MQTDSKGEHRRNIREPKYQTANHNCTKPKDLEQKSKKDTQNPTQPQHNTPQKRRQKLHSMLETEDLHKGHKIK